MHRQAQREQRAAVVDVPDTQSAAHLLNDAVGDGETEPDTLADGLGGEEGVEDAVADLRIHAGPVVGDRDADHPTIGPSRDPDLSWRRARRTILESLHCVHQEVEHHLADAPRVAAHEGHVAQAGLDECVVGRLAADEGEGEPQVFVEVDRLDPVVGLIFFSVPVFGVDFPLIVGWLIVAATVFTLYFGFIQFRGFTHSISIVKGDYLDPNDAGEVTPFQALTTALGDRDWQVRQAAEDLIGPTDS